MGDMIGDGDHDPWVEREYAKTLKALGLMPKKKRRDNSEKINELMKRRIEEVPCECGGKLSQSRKGSTIGKCEACGNRYRLLEIKKRKKG